MSTFVSFAGRGTQVSVQSRATVSSSPPPLPSPSSAFPLHMCWTHIFKILDYRRAKSQVCPGCLSAQHRSPESGLSHSKAVLFPLHLFTSVMSRNSISWRLELWEIRKKKKKDRAILLLSAIHSCSTSIILVSSHQVILKQKQKPSGIPFAFNTGEYFSKH